MDEHKEIIREYGYLALSLKNHPSKEEKTKIEDRMHDIRQELSLGHSSLLSLAVEEYRKVRVS